MEIWTGSRRCLRTWLPNVGATRECGTESSLSKYILATNNLAFDIEAEQSKTIELHVIRDANLNDS